jgi:hypothetical protein
MTLSPAQLDKIIEIYATTLVDNMDLDGLMEFAYDVIVENMSNLGEEDILNEVYGYFEDDADRIIESVSQGESQT